MKKRLLAAVLTVMMLMTSIISGGSVFAADDITSQVTGTSVVLKSDKLNAINASAPVSLGAPISDVQILGSLTHVREDGDTIVYAVTSGPPAIFFAYNVDKDVVEAKHDLHSADGNDAAKVSYCIVMDSKGVINIATQSDCMFFRYNPKTDEIRNYGKVFAETAVMSPGYVDSEDNFYFGTYPNAKLIKYDVKTDKLVDLGTMITSGDYVRAIVGYKDKIFMGGIGNPTTPFVKYDIKTNKKITLPSPELKGVFTQSDVQTFYAANSAGKYLFAKCKISNINKYYLCVFDMETEQWVDYIEGTFHMHTTELDGDVVYIHKDNKELGKPVLHSYNVKTKELKPFAGLVYNNYIVSPSIVNLKDQVKYPGKTIIGGAGTNGIILLNLEKQEITFVKDILPKQSTNIRVLKAGYNDELILSAYMGSKFVIYDTAQEKNKLEGPSVQIEGLGVIDGKYYFGLYGKGRLTRFDPNIAPSTSNPKLLADLGKEEQDRAFVVTKGEDDDIVWGAVPDYGRLGGAIGIYDSATGSSRAYRNVVLNQSISGLAYKNGKLYGSTHIYGGLGIDAIDDYAKLFIMDYKTGKVEKTVDVKLKADKSKQYFAGGMSFGPDGNLWVATQKTLVCVDPATLGIKDEIHIGTGTLSLTKARYLPYSMEWDKDGILFTNIGNQISAVDIKTKEVKQLSKESTNALTLAENGNLYYIDNVVSINYLKKIVLSKDGVKSADSVMKNSTLLFVDSSMAYVNGEKKSLDSNNPNITAKVIDDRTLVPVRFLAENFGTKVDWDEATETVTLTLGSKVTKIVLNKKEITINNEKLPLDVPATTIDGRTMLPLRIFCEKVLGKVVFWDDRGLIVISDTVNLENVKDKDIIDSMVSMFK